MGSMTVTVEPHGAGGSGSPADVPAGSGTLALFDRYWWPSRTTGPAGMLMAQKESMNT
jgi:hypothetical protein